MDLKGARCPGRLGSVLAASGRLGVREVALAVGPCLRRQYQFEKEGFKVSEGDDYSQQTTVSFAE